MGAPTHGCPTGRGDRLGGLVDRRLRAGEGLVSRKLGASCALHGQFINTGMANRCHAERIIQADRHREPFGPRRVDTGGVADPVPGVPGAQERRGVPVKSLGAGGLGCVRTLRAFATVEISVARQRLMALTRMFSTVSKQGSSCDPGHNANRILRISGTAGARSGLEIDRSSVLAAGRVINISPGCIVDPADARVLSCAVS